MLITIYKGFDSLFLENIPGTPVISTSYKDKLDVNKFDNRYKKKLKLALLMLESDAWITYQEFLSLEKTILVGYEDGDYDLKIIRPR